MPTSPSRRRLAAGLVSVVALAGGAGAAWTGAEAVAKRVEARARQDVAAALRGGGQAWADVAADGLRVRLTGTAPSELDRFRALTLAAGVVDPARLVDNTVLASAEDRQPPPFAVEILRTDAGISLIGLVPASTDRAALVRPLRAGTVAPPVADLLESADHPAPKGWNEAVGFGLLAAGMAEQAKISIRPGQVSVEAIAGSPDDKDRLAAALRQRLPAGVSLDTAISAPPPVIAPFALRFALENGTARLEACTADTEAGRDRIVAAATRAGAGTAPACTLGLGAPSPDWAGVAEAAIDTVAAIGAGRVTLSDADLRLDAPAGTDPAAFDTATGRLRGGLPPPFVLEAVLADGPEAPPPTPPAFVAILSPAGSLSMTGAVSDAQMRNTVDSVARAHFGRVEGGLTENAAAPGGWTLRLIAAIEALGALQSGRVEVTPDTIRVTGLSGDPVAPETVASALFDRLGPGVAFDAEIRYDRRLDPALDLPDGAECVRGLNIVMSESEMGFEPARPDIAGDPAPTLDRLAGVMADCADFRIEAGGHTDSQGSETFNAELSRSRAQALVAAMADAGIDTGNMTVRGYGESQPIAPNDTDAGREENRRIAFRLLSEDPVEGDEPPPPLRLSGLTAPPGPSASEGDEAIGPVQPFGPAMPGSPASPAAPATPGASETYGPPMMDDAWLQVPVLAPGPDTPRPTFRPAGGPGAADSPDTP